MPFRSDVILGNLIAMTVNDVIKPMVSTQIFDYKGETK